MTVKRFSAVTTHPAYLRDYYRYRVTCDSLLVVDCVHADAREGVVGYFERNSTGAFIPNKDGTGPRINFKRGLVVIRRTDEPVDKRYSQEYLRLFMTNVLRIAR